MTDNKYPHPLVSIIPVAVLIGLLAVVITLFGSDALSGGSQIALLLGVAGFISGTDEVTGQTVITITNEESVRQMIWALFSLFPAAIALIMAFLIYLYPIKK